MLARGRVCRVAERSRVSSIPSPLRSKYSGVSHGGKSTLFELHPCHPFFAPTVTPARTSEITMLMLRVHRQQEGGHPDQSIDYTTRLILLWRIHWDINNIQLILLARESENKREKSISCGPLCHGSRSLVPAQERSGPASAQHLVPLVIPAT